VSPYRQGPPSHPPEPWRDPRIFVLAPALCMLLSADWCAVGPERIFSVPVDTMIGLVFGAIALMFAFGLGVSRGRRLQHEAWLKSLGATESLDTIAVEVHAPRIRTVSRLVISGNRATMHTQNVGIDMTVEVVNGCARVVGQPMRTPDEAREDWDELIEAMNGGTRKETP
jgi:hypothetical protein